MSLSSSLSEQERLLAEQNGQKDFTEIEEREQERVINFKALILQLFNFIIIYCRSPSGLLFLFSFFSVTLPVEQFLR